jgi:hypothetical protein
MARALLVVVRRFWWAAPAAVAAALVWAIWPSPGLPGGAAPTRQYLNFDACLLTDARGVAGNPAAAVWSGMQESSLATRARVSYLPVLGPSTRAAALPYLASLIERHGAVVLAVGAAQSAAVTADAARFPLVRFITVGGAAAAAPVTRIGAQSAPSVRAAVSKAITDAVSQASAQ